MADGPFAWMRDNADTMGLSLIATFGLSISAAMLRRVSFSVLLVSLISSHMITAISVPMAMIWGNLPWPWGAFIGGLIGITSLPLMWLLIGIADRIQKRAPDIADGAINRVLPGTPPPGGQT